MHDLSSAPEMPAIGLPLVALSRVRADRCNGAGGGSFAKETISLRLAGLALRAATKLQPVAAILQLVFWAAWPAGAGPHSITYRMG